MSRNGAPKIGTSWIDTPSAAVLASLDMKDNDVENLAASIQSHYERQGKPLDLDEYLQVFREDPAQQCRGAAQYIRDAFDYFGSRTIDSPAGKLKRFSLFDAEFTDGLGRVAGQEEAQTEIYKLLNNFVREGSVNRLILLHGPNGSAKTSIVHAIIQALEHYSTTAEGTLYRFRWLFPSDKIARSNIGFGDKPGQAVPEPKNSFAHLPGEDLDAVLECEFNDHPLLLIPIYVRRKLFERLEHEGRLVSDEPVPDYLLHGDLCAKCRKIYDALLASYGGDSSKVFRHIQVQRLNMSWRYRRGLATVEPQMHVDAGQQQLTASRGLASLPPAIAHLSLFESRGPLVEANRGLLEYNDLLKRPVDTFKYLLSTCESGQVSLDRSSLFIDTVLLGSTNEMLLDAFKEYADFSSFKGRLELVRVPYLRKISDEEQIYKNQFPRSSLDRHLAPHTLHIAALWAVLTRLRRPEDEPFSGELKETVAKLTPLEKALLYDHGEAPAHLSSSIAGELRAVLPEIYSLAGHDYEGRTGASAREVRMLLMNTAQREEHACVSPLGLFEEILSLIEDKTVFAFLKLPAAGDYMDQAKIVELVQSAYLDLIEEEAAEAMGLVTETSYSDLFDRYVQHVTHWLKKEKLQDSVTGQPLPPDEVMMKEVEAVIRPTGEEEEAFRKNLIGRIGAYVLGEGKDRQAQGPPEYAKVFPSLFDKLHEDFFARRRLSMQKSYRMFLEFMEGNVHEGKDADAMRNMHEALIKRFHYCDNCAKEAMAFLLKKRYQ